MRVTQPNFGRNRDAQARVGYITHIPVLSLTFYAGSIGGEHLQVRGLAGIAGEVTDVRHEIAQAGRTALQEVGDQPDVGVQLGNLYTWKRN